MRFEFLEIIVLAVIMHHTLIFAYICTAQSIVGFKNAIPINEALMKYDFAPDHLFGELQMVKVETRDNWWS